MSRALVVLALALVLGGCGKDIRPPMSTALVVTVQGDSVYVVAQYMNTDNQTVRFFIDNPQTTEKATWQVFAAPLKNVRYIHEVKP